MRLARLQNSLRIPDTRPVSLPNPLQCQRGNQRRPNTAPILCRPYINEVLLVARPVQNLPQRNRAPRFEVRVLVEDGAVGADVAGPDVLLLADGSGAAGRQARRAHADELGQAAEELALALGDAEFQLLLEDVVGFLEILVDIPALGDKLAGSFQKWRKGCALDLLFNGREEGCIDGVRFAQAGDVLAGEDLHL